MSVVDRTKLNAEVANLASNQTADPETLEAVLIEIYSNLDIRPENTEVLTKTNTTAYTPSANYHPTTLKYVVDAINAAISSVVGTPIIQTGTTFPATPTNGQTFFNTDENKLYVYSSSAWRIPTDVFSQIYGYRNSGGF